MRSTLSDDGEVERPKQPSPSPSTKDPPVLESVVIVTKYTSSKRPLESLVSSLVPEYKTTPQVLESVVIVDP